MSDSELSDAPSHAIPSDATLETELRRVVRDALKQDENITVRLARTRVEEQLGLGADFFTRDEWKKRSKDIITAAVDEPESPLKEKPKAGRKRKSEEPAKKPTKRAKKSAVVESDDDDDEMDESMTEEGEEEEEDEEEEEEEEEKPKRKSKAQAKAKPPPKPKAKPKTKAKPSPPVVESDEDEDGKNDTPKAEPGTKAATIDSEAEDEQPQTNETSETMKPDDDQGTSHSKPSEPADEDNDSDMSVLIDDPPPRKKGVRAKKSASPGTTTSKTAKTTKKAATTTASSKDLSPDEEEIKRLQSWLVKCGIRKLWHRELADDKFPTSKSKIAHLKSMLTDAGMTGRFSAEKAKSIKEARELEAELEAAREFEQQFGTGGRGRRAKKNANVKDQGSDDDEDGDEEEGEKAEGAKRPGGRLLPKGLVDFGDSGDDGSD